MRFTMWPNSPTTISILRWLSPKAYSTPSTAMKEWLRWVLPTPLGPCRHHLTAVLAPVTLGGYLGDCHIHNPVEFGPAPLVLAFAATSRTLSRGLRGGLDMLLCKIYDEHARDASNWLCASPILKVALPFSTLPIYNIP